MRILRIVANGHVVFVSKLEKLESIKILVDNCQVPSMFAPPRKKFTERERHKLRRCPPLKKIDDFEFERYYEEKKC